MTSKDNVPDDLRTNDSNNPAEFPFLPIGSVVELEGGEHPVMVAGVMVRDAISGKLWDYVGYPYPEGRGGDSMDHFFDNEMIANVLQMGFMDQQAIGFQVWLNMRNEEYREARAQQNQ